MSTKRREYEYGRIVSVDVVPLGDNLAADATAGATSITVEDACDFDEDGGLLLLDAVVYAYTTWVEDDATGVGTITLSGALSAASTEGTVVALYDPTYQVAASDKVAQVELVGDDGNVDVLEANIALHLADKIDEGVRGPNGEQVKLELEGDEWVIVDIFGIEEAKGQGIRWEADDTHTLTGGEITAGTITFSLSKFPTLESMFLVVAGAPQRPTQYTVDYAAPSVTVPLSGWEKSGDAIWVHYTYWGVAQDGEADQPPAPPIVTPPATTEATPIQGNGGVASQPTMPTDAIAGDLLIAVLTHASSSTITASGWSTVGATGSVTYDADGGTLTYITTVLTLVHPGGTPTLPTFSSLAFPQPIWSIAVLRGPSTVSTSQFGTVGDAHSANAPSLSPYAGIAVRIWACIMGDAWFVSASAGDPLNHHFGTDVDQLVTYDSLTTPVAATLYAGNGGWMVASLGVS